MEATAVVWCLGKNRMDVMVCDTKHLMRMLGFIDGIGGMIYATHSFPDYAMARRGTTVFSECIKERSLFYCTVSDAFKCTKKWTVSVSCC